MPHGRPEAGMESDFNPGFSFDFGPANGPAQTPWEFSGAIRQAQRDQSHNLTSIDHKIGKRLEAKANKQGAKRKASQLKAAAAAEPDSDSAGDDDDDDDDIPLPGELDSSDSQGSEHGQEDAIEDAKSEGQAPQRSKKQQAAKTDRQLKRLQQHIEAEEDVGEAEGGEEDDEEQSVDDDDEDDVDEEEEDGVEEGDGGGEEGSDEDGEELEEEEEEVVKAPPAKRQKQAAADKVAKPAPRPSAKSPAPSTAVKPATNGKAGGFYAETPEGTKFTSGGFGDLNLSRPLINAVAALGYSTPTPIQAACIPLALAGRDICGSAITGSGKTAAYALPILERLLHRPRQVQATYVLILTPTRELAVQVHSMVQKLGQFTDVRAALIVGGLSMKEQEATLRTAPEVVVATPGRLIDHLRNTMAVGLEDLAVLVLDEADRLLEMGFKEEIQEIVRQAPRKRQTLLFSATFTEEVKALVQLSLKQPVRLAADASLTAPRTLAQEVVRLKGAAASANKEATLMALCGRSFAGGRTIIFCRTKQRAHRMKILFGLAKLPPAAELHGDMTQAARLESLERFRQGSVAFLLATDVASRGLDIQGVQVIINYDAPRTLETYLHRIGRTARAGSSGLAVTFVEDADRTLLRDAIKKAHAQVKARIVPQQTVRQWQGRIERLAGDVARIQEEERDERAIRKAEMEAAKAENMLEHEAEIYSRPARTWFQTGKEKLQLEEKTRQAAGGQEDGDDQEGKKGKKDKAKSKGKEKPAKGEMEKKRKRSELQTETEGFTGKIKAAKSRARAIAQEHGIPIKKAAKLAAASVSGVNNKKQKKHKRDGQEGGQGAGGSGGKSGLFSGDGSGKQAGKGEGRKRSSGDGRPGRTLSKTEKNVIKRGGKGKNAFKSKKKFKRR